MLNSPFSPWPSFSAEEAWAVHRTLLTNKVNYWTGNECREFEKEFAAFAGTRYAIALANGTVALDLALKVLGVGLGDEVIVTSRTFLASASCIVTAGATPVFADVDLDSQNITAETIAAVLTPRTRAIICVHLAGWPCDMDPIMALAAKHGVYVIEDCAQAHGARYKGRPVGGIGHMGAWSFCQDKIMTTGGEGGMLTLNDPQWWSRAWSYKDHGKSWEALYAREHPPGFRWVHERFGTNWRMIEIQAVIGRLQLQRMPEWTAARGRNADRIAQACSEFAALRVPKLRCASCVGTCNAASGCVHAYYKHYVFVRPEHLRAGWSRDRIIDAINSDGVPCYQGSCSEVYLEKAFDGTGWRPKERLPTAKELGETSLMFLVHPTLTESEIDKTCRVIPQVMSEASV
jgi:dTDP-4-amino-4,6-dideoxygalactose transaminase